MKRTSVKRLSAALAAVLAGGSVFGTCEMRLRDSLVQGTELFLLQLLDPSNIIVGDEMLGEEEGEVVPTTDGA